MLDRSTSRMIHDFLYLQLLGALEFFHTHKTSYHSINSDNVLVWNLDPLIVKLSDVGITHKKCEVKGCQYYKWLCYIMGMIGCVFFLLLAMHLPKVPSQWPSQHQVLQGKCMWVWVWEEDGGGRGCHMTIKRQSPTPPFFGLLDHGWWVLYWLFGAHSVYAHTFIFYAPNHSMYAHAKNATWWP